MWKRFQAMHRCPNFGFVWFGGFGNQSRTRPTENTLQFGQKYTRIAFCLRKRYGVKFWVTFVVLLSMCTRYYLPGPHFLFPGRRRLLDSWCHLLLFSLAFHLMNRPNGWGVGRGIRGPSDGWPRPEWLELGTRDTSCEKGAEPREEDLSLQGVRFIIISFFRFST